VNTQTNDLQFAGGWASIMPRGDVPLVGFGGIRMSRGGVGVPLEVNAILLQSSGQRVIVVQLDVLSVGDSLRQQVLERFAGRLRDEELFLVASHTHYAPGIDMRLPGHGMLKPSYLAETVETACQLLDRVLSMTLRPILFQFRAGQAAHSMNRRAWCWKPVLRFPPIQRVMGLHPNPAGPRDETVRLLSACNVGDAETPQGILWNYTCHPVTTWPEDVISADYPGVVRCALRSRFGADLPVVFLPGFSGNVRPNRIDRCPRSPYYMLHRLVNGPVFGRFSRRLSDRWTSSLADVAVQTASSQAREISVSGLRSARLRIPWQEAMEKGTDDRDLTLHAIHFDPHFSILGISTEPVIEYATALSQMFAPRTFLPVGYIDAVAAYLPTSEMLTEGGLEVTSPGYGLDGVVYRRDISNFILDSARKLLLPPKTDPNVAGSPSS
jgi:hypothetical protein